MAAPVPSVTVSRTTGLIPLGVFFDASGTTDADTSNPFHDLEYRWSFGDSEAGDWETGARQTSKNGAFGPVAAHVYETAGTYLWTLQVTDGTTTVTTTGTVTASDWPNDANTVCIGNVLPVNGANGVPSNATVDASSDFDAMITAHKGTNKRILFKTGDTFTASAASTITDDGPWMIGSYGSGARPIVNLSYNGDLMNLSGSGTPTINDFRIVGLDVYCNSGTNTSLIAGAGSFSQLTVFDNRINDCGFSLKLDDAILDNLNLATAGNGTTTLSAAEAAGQTVLSVNSTTGMSNGQKISIRQQGNIRRVSTIVTTGAGPTVTIADALQYDANSGGAVQWWTNTSTPVNPLWDQIFFVENTIQGSVGAQGDGKNGVFASGGRVAYLGNLIDGETFGEHGIRAPTTQVGIYSSNTVKNFPSAALTLRSLDWGGTPTIAESTPSQKGVVTNNLMTSISSAGGNGPINDTATGRTLNWIWEGNFATSLLSSATNLLTFYGEKITARNNIIDMSGNNTSQGAIAILIAPTIYVPTDRVNLFNNTMYRSTDIDPGAGNSQLANYGGGVTTSVAKNNLIYSPQVAAAAAKGIVDNSAGGLTASNNTSDGAQCAVSPEFIGPLTSITGFKIAAASYAATGGTATGVPISAYGNDLFNGFDLGNDAQRMGAAGPASQYSYRSVP